MATTSKITDGKLVITKTPASTEESFERKEVVNRIDEIQTRIDHRNLDNTTDLTEKAEWEVYLTEIDK